MPGHIHFVVQPVTAAVVAALGSYGPALQAAMFATGQEPDPAEVEKIADEARRLFAATGST